MSSLQNELATAFRSKVNFMKTWKPASTPSNRDRLELYALNKQAVSGDAPATFSTTANTAERAKYQAWRGKVGMDATEAMRLYMQEAERQIRVYGSTAPVTPSATANGMAASIGVANGSSMDTPRGLAAIPLLCAAAAESRTAYIRRLGQTAHAHAWWRRQEALCGTPGTITAIPEMMVLGLAQLVEHISLSTPIPNVVQSFLWPLHNSFLSLWMLIILVMTMMECVWYILQIVIWGARRTGFSLDKIWDHDLQLWVQCVNGMCESHQATTCRLVGLVLLPASYSLALLKRFVGSKTLASSIFVLLFMASWWYFLFVLPWLSACLLGAATTSGICFALIEVAGI